METTIERRWVRRPSHRVIAGVAGGIADATGTGALWWRLGFIVMTLVGGLGVLIYLLLWWVLPRADLPRSAGQRLVAHFPDAPAWVGVALLMLGAVLLADQFDLWTPSIGWAFLLIGLGVVLFKRDAERRDASGADPSPQGEPAPSWTQGADEEPLPWMPTSGAVARPRPPRERSWLGWLTLGVALTVVGIAWFLNDAGSSHLSISQLFALPLTVIGAGLLVGGLIGRAKATILLALPLVPIVVLASLIPVPLTGRWESHYLTPHTAASLRTTYEQSGGDLQFNFTKLQPGEHVAPITATVGVGSISVLVPKGTSVSISATSAFGSVFLLGGQSISGFGSADSVDVRGSDPIVMTLEVGLGEVNVYYVQPSKKKANG